MTLDKWQRIEALFDAAVGMEPGGRAAFLDDECRGDTELRNEVLTLLASDEAAGNFIEHPVWTGPNALDTNAKEDISDSVKEFGARTGEPHLGFTIGPFTITNEIGSGGMGSVYLAERSDGEFEQRVAVKVIKTGMDSDFIVRRFRIERQILASLDHPFISRLYDGGSTPTGSPYFVMEYIVGATIYDHCDKHRLDIRSRIEIFQKICSAIEYAHKRLIIHRDIKPGNIVITDSGDPKLLDFGIAKILDPDLIHESMNPTGSMFRLMTPDYASPEQMHGSEITPASDIYSLGVLLYELLSGHKPYSLTELPIHEVSRLICELPPDPPSLAVGNDELLLARYAERAGSFLEARRSTAGDLRSALVGDLDNIILKALAKLPSKRYRSVKDLSDDITRHLNGAAIEAADAEMLHRMDREIFLPLPKNSRSIAILPFKLRYVGDDSDTENRFLGLGLADALVARLSKIRRFLVRPTSSVIQYDDDRVDPIVAGKELGVDYVLDGNIKQIGARIRVTVQLLNVKENAAIWATSVDETLSDVLALEDSIATKVIELLMPQLSGTELEQFEKRGTENPNAFEEYLRGRYYFSTMTEEGLAKSLIGFHRAIAFDPEYALAYTGIADYYNWLGIIGVLSPDQCFQPAIEAASKAVELDNESSEAHASLGFSLHAGRRDWSRAEHHLRRAILLNPSNANAYVWYSIVLYTQGRFTEGLDSARRSLVLDPVTPFNHHNLAWGFYFARQFDESAAEYQRVIDAFPNYGFGYYGLSKVKRFVGESKDAIELNDKAVQLMEGSVFSQLCEAECFAADGRIAEAVSKLDALKQLTPERYVSPNQMALVYCYLARETMEPEMTDRALECIERSCADGEAWLNWLGIEPVFDVVREQPRFVAVLEKTGYNVFQNQFHASGINFRTGETRPVTPLTGDETTLYIERTETSDAIGKETVEKPVRGRMSVLEWGLAATVLLLVALGAYYLYQHPGRPAGQTFASATVVVLPFTSSGDDRSLGVGLADALANKLGNIRNIQVISPNSARMAAKWTDAEVRERLRVSHLVRGYLVRSQGSATLAAKMIDAATGDVVWQREFTAGDGDLFSLQKMVAENIWTSLNIEPLSGEIYIAEKSYTTDPKAYENYLIGTYQSSGRSSEGLRKAIVSFSESLKIDPKFAPAYVGLADAYSLLNLYDTEPPPDAYRLAKEHAMRALSLDDDLAEAHASLAYVKFYGDRDREGSELEFRRATQLNPSYAQAHHWFALALAGSGDAEKAIAEIKIAQRLDPGSPAVHAAAGMTYFFAGELEQALAECDAALAIDEAFIPAYKVKRWAYSAMEDQPNAAEMFEKEIRYSGGTREYPGWRVIALQVAPPGEDRKKLTEMLDAAAASPQVRDKSFVYAFETALAYLQLGDHEKALKNLEAAEAANSHGFNFTAVDPRLSPLRSHPRFAALLAKLARPRR